MTPPEGTETEEPQMVLGSAGETVCASTNHDDEDNDEDNDRDDEEDDKDDKGDCVIAVESSEEAWYTLSNDEKGFDE
jgi:hypothetical protein